MNNLLRFSVIISLLGILILLFLSLIIQPKITKISEITKENLNQKVKIEASIIKITPLNTNFYLLTLGDNTKNITATLNSYKKLQIDNTKTYIIMGKVQEYEKELQININSISSLS